VGTVARERAGPEPVPHLGVLAQRGGPERRAHLGDGREGPRVQLAHERAVPGVDHDRDPIAARRGHDRGDLRGLGIGLRVHRRLRQRGAVERDDDVRFGAAIRVPPRSERNTTWSPSGDSTAATFSWAPRMSAIAGAIAAERRASVGTVGAAPGVREGWSPAGYMPCKRATRAGGGASG